MNRFSATVELGGRTATGIEVSDAVVGSLGAGNRPAVRVTINGFTYRSTVARMGGRFMLPVSADVRAQSGVSAGDEVEVGLELDTEPRTVEIPDDLAAALAADPALRAVWDTLSVTHRREHAEAIVAAKKPETRERRVAKALAMLREVAR